MENKKTASTALSSFQLKCSVAMSKIRNYKQFEGDEEMVKLIMDTGRTLFEKDLDAMTPAILIRLGGKLAGVFGYLGQRSSYARAERDVYEQKAREVEKELLLSRLDEKYKVTEARAIISSQMSELEEMVSVKEAEKLQWESIVESCQTMLMFIQSALKTKQAEGFVGKTLTDGG